MINSDLLLSKQSSASIGFRKKYLMSLSKAGNSSKRRRAIGSIHAIADAEINPSVPGTEYSPHAPASKLGTCTLIIEYSELGRSSRRILSRRNQSLFLFSSASNGIVGLSSSTE